MLITALDNTLPADGEPKAIVYIPEGSHTIRPTVDGKAKTITVKMEPEKGDQIAASFQSELDTIQAGNVRPFLDFDHKEGSASGLPKRFFYEKGKGLMLEVEWTGKGRKAIKGKDYSYFSPTFYKDDDGTPSGIPARGPLGSLVNSPAFRNIPRIAASEAKPTTKQPTMSKLIFAALKVNAAADNAEDAALSEIEKLKKSKADIEAKLEAMQSEYDGMKKKVESAEATIKATNKDRAESLVKAAVADGRILPKDDDTQRKFRDRIEAGDTFAEEILAQMPKKNPDITKTQVKASGEKITDGDDFQGEAQKLITAGRAKTNEEAFVILASEKPDLYEAYNRQFAGDSE